MTTHKLLIGSCAMTTCKGRFPDHPNKSRLGKGMSSRYSSIVIPFCKTSLTSDCSIFRSNILCMAWRLKRISEQFTHWSSSSMPFPVRLSLSAGAQRMRVPAFSNTKFLHRRMLPFSDAGGRFHFWLEPNNRSRKIPLRKICEHVLQRRGIQNPKTPLLQGRRFSLGDFFTGPNRQFAEAALQQARQYCGLAFLDPNPFYTRDVGHLLVLPSHPLLRGGKKSLRMVSSPFGATSRLSVFLIKPPPFSPVASTDDARAARTRPSPHIRITALFPADKSRFDQPRLSRTGRKGA